MVGHLSVLGDNIKATIEPILHVSSSKIILSLDQALPFAHCTSSGIGSEG